MSSVDAWLDLANAVARCPDESGRAQLTRGLARLLDLSPDRQQVTDESATRADPGSSLLRQVLAASTATARTGTFAYAAPPVFSEAQSRRARAAAAALAQGADADPDDLAALSPDAAAPLVEELVSSARYDVLARAEVAMAPHRFPVAMLVRTAAAMLPELPARAALVHAAARASDLQLLRGLAEVVGSAGAALSAVAAVVDELVAVRRQLAFAPYRWWPDDDGRWPHPPEWREPTDTASRPRPAADDVGSSGSHAPGVPAPSAPQPAPPSAPPPAPVAPPSAAPPPPPPAPGAPAEARVPPPVSAAPRSRRGRRWPFGRGHRSEPPPVFAQRPPPATSAGEEPVVFRGPESERREAYPRIELSGTERADVVVVDQPFDVTAGLQGRRDRALVAAPPMTFVAGETVTLELVLLFDPASLAVSGAARVRLTVSDAEPFPAATFTCTALYGEELSPERRIGMQLVREGQVVAIAWRSFVAVESPDEVATAVVPPRREVALLDLDPLVGDEPPDLVVSVCRADAGSTTFVWTAYAADPTVAVPDLPSARTLEGDVAAFATEARRAIQFSTDLAKDYLDLAGRARRIGRAIPEGIQDVVRELMARPGRSTAPTVLLLTEELSVPWELGAFDPPLSSSWGGDSPFLGAQVAVSRWPLTEHRPRPRPRNRVAVRSGAVLTADYQGVPGWGRLDSALAEAEEVVAMFQPAAARVAPELWAVTDLFRGQPVGDVVHVALHGQYDAQGDQEGLVLLTKSPAGGAVAQFLSAVDLENGRLDHGPFVFLNACQVGADEQVLGDYGGFASTLLRIGATAVVAPLWNVRDDVAASFARRFYAATLTDPEPVTAAEAVRALRATYTESGVRAGDAGLHATLVAYQVFGHPCLRLARDPAG